MELVVDIWEDLQFTYHFEGLLVFCAGKKNTLADIASRVDRTEVEQTMSDEIQRQGLGNLQLTMDEVTWRVGDIEINIEDALISNWQKRTERGG